MSQPQSVTESPYVMVPQAAWEHTQQQVQAAQEQQRRAELHEKTLGSLAALAQDFKHFMALAMAVCNQLAADFAAARVTLGILKGRQVHVVAMSHTEKILRKMQAVILIEEAMEECLDQDCEVLVPAPPDSKFLYRCAEKLSQSDEHRSVLVLPLRHGELGGALLFEFAAPRTPDQTELETMRRLADLLTPRIADAWRHERWIGVKLAESLRRGLALAVGPKHTWVKAAAVAIAGLLGWAIFGVGTFRIRAPFRLEPTRQAQVIAPFDGYLRTVDVLPGDEITAKQTTLATLDTASLRDQLATAEAKRSTYLKQEQIAQSRGKFADAQIAADGANAAAARIRLLKREIRHADIRSALSGEVLTGRLERKIGSPVRKGQVLFTVAPLKPLVARIRVADADILYIHAGESGSLAPASNPGIKVRLVVSRVDPAAQVRHKKNVFDVWARLIRPPTWFHPGMQGTARIDAGKGHYIWIWTRRLIDWLRMKLWV